MSTKQRNKRFVLSLAGGGARGLIPAMAMAEMEKQLGRPLYQAFDMMYGTSTGAIVASGLAMGVPATDIEWLYNNLGGKMFPSSTMRKWKSWVRGPKYPYQGILEELESRLGKEAKLGDVKTNLGITAYDIYAQKPRIKKSWAGRYKNYSLVQAVRSSTAAPTYFAGNHIGDEHLVDGGIAINNPAMAAFCDAVLLWPDDEIHLISFECGSKETEYTIDETDKFGVIQWVAPLIDAAISSGNDEINFYCRHLLPASGHVFYQMTPRLKKSSVKMDDVSPENIKNLQIDAKAMLTYGVSRERFDEFIRVNRESKDTTEASNT